MKIRSADFVKSHSLKVFFTSFVNTFYINLVSAVFEFGKTKQQFSTSFL